MPEYIGQRQSEEQKKRAYIEVRKQLLREGDLSGIIELSVMAKTPKDAKLALPEDYKTSELRELGEIGSKVIDRHIEAYATAEPKREPNKVESEEISRLVRLAKSGASSDAKTDLMAYAHRLASYGVCMDSVKRKIAEELR